MTQEEKQLLFKDLCARLPYGVFVSYPSFSDTPQLVQAISDYGDIEINDYTESPCKLEHIKPYLRPMSSMTEEEEKEIRMLHHCFYREGNGWITAGVFGTNDCGCTVFEMADMLNYLNAHHFDYRGLIEMGLALEAPEGMYNKN